MPTKVVVLGGGFGGLELSRLLSDELTDQVEVTLIDRADGFVFGFSKFRVLFEGVQPDAVRYGYGDVRMPHVTVRREEVTAIDPASRRVTTAAGSYDADVLVVALGAGYAPQATPGFAEGGSEFYSVEGALQLHRALQGFEGGRIVFGVLGVPYKCPPAPYEFLFLLHDFLAARGIRERTEISFVNPMPAPLPPSPETSKAILDGLDERGIAYEFGHRVASLDPRAKVARTGDGRDLAYDLFVGVPVHRVPGVVAASGITEGGNDGWVKVDARTLRTPWDGVYAIGDCADPPVPRAGVFAESAAAVAAAHIVAGARGGSSDASYAGRGVCYIEFGGGTVGMVTADFLSGAQPALQFAAPSAARAEEKREFERTRAARWFGA